MARPPSRELTERELEVMHVFWRCGDATAQEARDHLAARGPDLTYSTVATLVRILVDKGFLVATNAERPFRYRPTRPFDEVSRRLVEDLIEAGFSRLARTAPPVPVRRPAPRRTGTSPA